MQIRDHEADGIRSRAVFSGCGAYRYRLTRRWAEGPIVNYVMLNPSRADERANDPTVERCARRALQMGYAGFAVTNIFAWRATDPRDLCRATKPTGAENDRILMEAAQQAQRVIAAWGVHGAHLGRGPQVAGMLAAAGVPLWHLGLSKAGHPRHPLYVPYSRVPTIWEKAAAFTER